MLLFIKFIHLNYLYVILTTSLDAKQSTLQMRKPEVSERERKWRSDWLQTPLLVSAFPINHTGNGTVPSKHEYRTKCETDRQEM